MVVGKGVVMEIGFNPSVGFSAVKPQETSSASSVPISEYLHENGDSVDLKSRVHNEEKKRPVRNFIANVAKFFATTTEMVKGTIKGSAYGILSGAAVLGGSWLFGALPRGFRKGGSLKDVCTHPLKNIGTKSKVVAALVTLAVGSYHIVAAKLKANQKTANVDHQLKTGHRAV